MKAKQIIFTEINRAELLDIELSSVTNGSKYNNYNIEFEPGSKLTITAAPEVEEPDANEDN